MSFLMLLAATRSRQLKSQTFNASGNFTIPVGVSRLESVTGKGQDGIASIAKTSNVVVITYHGSGTGAPGSSITWENVQGEAESVAADVTNSGVSNFTRSTVQVYPDETNTLVQTNVTITGESGTAVFSSGWRTSGHISASGTSSVSYRSGGTIGDNTTGFGKTFFGGDHQAAVSSSYQNIPVTPGQVWPLQIAAGGSITITYYE